MRFYKNHSNGISYSLRGANSPTCLIFAEGDAEALFLEKWLTAIDRDPSDIAVLCYRGSNKLGLLFSNLTIDSNFPNVKRFGFFLDAENGNATVKSAMVSKLLVDHKVVPGGSAIDPGAPFTTGAVRVTICVSPNNANPGFIEHTVMNEIATKPLALCVDDFRQCVAQVSGMPVNPKTLVQAYLGAMNPRLCGTGRGFESGILDVMHDAYVGIRNTLTPVL